MARNKWKMLLAFIIGKWRIIKCKVEERYNREVKQNYKLVVVPVEPDETIASSSDFYTSDMMSLIQSGYIKIVA